MSAFFSRKRHIGLVEIVPPSTESPVEVPMAAWKAWLGIALISFLAGLAYLGILLLVKV